MKIHCKNKFVFFKFQKKFTNLCNVEYLENLHSKVAIKLHEIDSTHYVNLFCGS